MRLTQIPIALIRLARYQQNNYGYTGVNCSASPQVGGVVVCDRYSHTTGSGHINPTGKGHKTGGTTGGTVPVIGAHQQVVHKDYVLDYTSPLKNAIMEYESGVGGLTYRYVYGLEKVATVIYGIPNGAGSVMQQYEYPNSTENTVHPYDHVLDVYFAQARMYDAGDRRFVAADPMKGYIVNPQSLNSYAYAQISTFTHRKCRIYRIENATIPARNNADKTVSTNENSDFLIAIPTLISSFLKHTFYIYYRIKLLIFGYAFRFDKICERVYCCNIGIPGNYNLICLIQNDIIFCISKI